MLNTLLVLSQQADSGGEHLDNYTYSGSNDMMEVAWCFGMADYPTHEVKLKKPNSLGIYDMNGNVCEWCFDWDYLNVSDVIVLFFLTVC